MTIAEETLDVKLANKKLTQKLERQEKRHKLRLFCERFWNGCANIFWNIDNNHIFMHRPIMCVFLLIFYLFYYTALASFSYFLLMILFKTLDWNEPKVKDVIQIGLGYRPVPDTMVNFGSPLIWYLKDDPEDEKFWHFQLTEFINPYEHAVQNMDNKSNLIDCVGRKLKADKSRSCIVNTNRFGPCHRHNGFGYEKGEPCVLLKINKIYGWRPEKIDPDKDKDIFNQMPHELQMYVNSSQRRKAYGDDFVWISCDGQNPSDKQHMGNLRFYPEPGIPFLYFPYLRQKEYQTPFIFVQFLNPRLGVLINIECTAWAKNIKRDRRTRHGVVLFGLMVE